jgi:hypothetical protein
LVSGVIHRAIKAQVRGFSRSGRGVRRERVAVGLLTAVLDPDASAPAVLAAGAFLRGSAFFLGFS